MFANFADFAFYRMEIGRAHLVAGFGRIVDLKPQDILTDVSDCEGPCRSRGRRNRAHELRITPMLAVSMPPNCSARRMAIGVASASIPEGLELQNGRTALRLPFPQRVTAPGPLRAVLKELRTRHGKMNRLCDYAAPA